MIRFSMTYCKAAGIFLAVLIVCGTVPGNETGMPPKQEPLPGMTSGERRLDLSSPVDWWPWFYAGKGRVERRPADCMTATLDSAAKLMLSCSASHFPAGWFDMPEKARVVLELELLSGAAELQLRFRRKADKKEFRMPMRQLKPGRNRLEFRPDTFAETGILTLNNIFLQSGGEAKVRLESVTIEGLRPGLDLVDIGFKGAYPLNVENPERGRPVALQLTNTGDTALRAKLDIRFTDVHGRPAGKLARELKLNRHAAVSVELPPAEQLGIRYGNYTLVNTDFPGQVRKGRFSVARMIPAGPTPGRGTGFLFGIQAHPQRYSEAIQRREAAAAALCGAKIIRKDADWASIQPGKDIWDFSRIDRMVEIYEKQGLEFQLIYCYTPRWAVAGDWKPVRPQSVNLLNSRPDYGAWREFIRRTAGRYRDKIRFFEAWNEPDGIGFANFTAAEYLRMLKIAYQETRSAAPDSLMLTGGFTCMPPWDGLHDQKFQEKTLANGKGFYDIHAFHGHGSLEHYAPQIERMLVLRRKLGVTAPWWPNETADNSIYIGEFGQAVTLWKKLFYSWAHGAVGYTWYDLRNDGFESGNPEHNFGMVTYDFFPKAVYPAYNTIARHFGNAEFLREATAFPELAFYEFRRGADLLAAGWNNLPDSLNRLPVFATDAASPETFDLFDNREKGKVTGGLVCLPVGRIPVGFRLKNAVRLEPVCELLKPATGIVLQPGQVSRLELVAENPCSRPRTMRLTPELPPGVTVAASVPEQKLGAREKRRICVVLAGSHSQENPREIGIRVELIGTGLGGTLRLPVRSSAEIGRDFPDEPDFILDSKQQATILAPADPTKTHLFWKGPEDLSAGIFLAAKDGVLKLKVEVTDDHHVQPYRNGEVWKGDNVQFALHVPGQNELWLFGLTRLQDGSPQCWVWKGPQKFDLKAVAEAMKLVTARDEKAKRTVYEAELPLKVIGTASAGQKNALRFTLLVNDNDGEMRESYLSLTSGVASEWRSDSYPVLKLK